MEAKRILVVEDNPVNRKLMLAMLAHLGLEASCAESGEEAVSLAASRSFDLVFMDINLPGIDGIEAMRLMRHAGASAEGRRVSDLPTRYIAITAHAMKGDEARFLEQGMDEVLTKPIDLGRLKEVVDRLGTGAVAGAVAADSPAVAVLDEALRATDQSMTKRSA
jgi:CheY-like chemotaxis protein